MTEHSNKLTLKIQSSAGQVWKSTGSYIVAERGPIFVFSLQKLTNNTTYRLGLEQIGRWVYI